MNTIKKLAVSFGLMMVALPAFAEEAAGATADASFVGLMAIGAGLGIGLAVFGAASGQGRAAAAALDGIARNPSAQGKMFVPLILSLALMESLVILTFLTSLNITDAIGKVLGGH